VRRSAIGLAVLVLGVVLAGCGRYSGGGEGPLKGAKIAFGSKEFTEQQILGQIAVQYLRHEGAAVWDQTGLVSSGAVRTALEGGDLDAYWEYTGTAWNTFFSRTDRVPDPDDLLRRVRKEDAKNGISWVARAPLNDTYALATSAKNSKALGIDSLGQLERFLDSPKGRNAKFCIASEFANRSDGFPGVQRTYGFKPAKGRVLRLDQGLIYSQIKDGTCTFGEVFESDGRIKSFDLVSLKDPKKFFLPYSATISIRTSTLRKYPQIERLMEPIAKKLTTNEMIDLNTKVDVDGELPDKVARDWLKDEGFTG
jgi:osmoprotectant transport system substrate-binding protein